MRWPAPLSEGQVLGKIPGKPTNLLLRLVGNIEKSQTRRKTGTESHGSSLPSRSHGRLPEGPKIAVADACSRLFAKYSYACHSVISA